MKLTPFLALSAAALFGTAAAHAQVVTPNPAPTIITTAPYTITQPGFYQLGADLTVANTTGNIITINASNVTLDFGGHYISGPTSPGTLFGVGISEQGNVIIRNGTVAFCYEGIGFNGNGTTSSIAVNETVQNMLITYCTHIGINLLTVNYSSILNNTISNITGATPTNGSSNYGVFAQGLGNEVSFNKIINVSGPSSTIPSAGVVNNGSANTCLSVGNHLTNCNVGLLNVSKYEDTLTINCTTAFSGGMAVGSNN